jgi:hypothetical protein
MNKKPAKKTAKKAAKKGAKKPAKKAKKGAKKPAKKARQRSFKKVNKKLKVPRKIKKTAVRRKPEKKIVRKSRSRGSAGKKPPIKNTIAVEDASSGKHFIVVLNKQRKMFSLTEMRKLVALSHSGSNDAVCGGEIFTWIKQNRRDVLLDAEISAGGRPLFVKLSAFLRKHYRVKKA